MILNTPVIGLVWRKLLAVGSCRDEIGSGTGPNPTSILLTPKCLISEPQNKKLNGKFKSRTNEPIRFQNVKIVASF